VVKMIIVDNRIRKIEMEFLNKLDRNILALPSINNVYEEISSHVDIYISKIKDTLIIEKAMYDNIKEKVLDNDICIVRGNETVKNPYPNDILYNVCVIGNNAIHNFKYTDKKLLEIIDKKGLNKININQGYSNCSIAVIDDNSAIVSDKKIANMLQEYGIDTLYIDEKLDIKLLDKKGNYSKMSGFIGGAIERMENNVIVFGDLNKIDKENKIRNFITSRNLNVIDFKGFDVIDYGGIIKI
jgi:hypothetical protein